MIEAKVHEVYTVEKTGETPVQDTVVVLKARDQERYLPIWIAVFQGVDIVLSLRGLKLERPRTYELMARVIERLGARLESIVISSFQNHTYHATLRLAVNDTVEEIDCRPSDALALALQANAPIFVTPEVLEINGCEDAASCVPEATVKPLELKAAA